MRRSEVSGAAYLLAAAAAAATAGASASGINNSSRGAWPRIYSQSSSRGSGRQGRAAYMTLIGDTCTRRRRDSRAHMAREHRVRGTTRVCAGAHHKRVHACDCAQTQSFARPFHGGGASTRGRRRRPWCSPTYCAVCGAPRRLEARVGPVVCTRPPGCGKGPAMGRKLDLRVHATTPP